MHCACPKKSPFEGHLRSRGITQFLAGRRVETPLIKPGIDTAYYYLQVSVAHNAVFRGTVTTWRHGVFC